MRECSVKLLGCMEQSEVEYQPESGCWLPHNLLEKGGFTCFNSTVERAIFGSLEALIAKITARRGRNAPCEAEPFV